MNFFDLWDFHLRYSGFGNSCLSRAAHYEFIWLRHSVLSRYIVLPACTVEHLQIRSVCSSLLQTHSDCALP